MAGVPLNTENWKEASPHVVIEAASQSTLVLPLGISLTNSEFVKHGNDLMIRSLDGVIITIRGYFETSNPPKFVESGSPEHARLTTEALFQDEELATEELAQEALGEETLDTIAAFETRAGTTENPLQDNSPKIHVVEGDYTNSFKSEQPASVFPAPTVNDGQVLEHGITQNETAPIPVTTTPVLVSSEIQSVITETAPATQPLSPAPSEPAPIIVAETAPVAATTTPIPAVPVEPAPTPDVVPTPTEQEIQTKTKGKKEEDEDDERDDESVQSSFDDGPSDEIFIFHQGDGKIKINDFDLGDIIRLEGIDSEDILVKSKGKHIEVSIVGDKMDSITLSHPHENDSNSYSVTQTDDGATLVTLDSE